MSRLLRRPAIKVLAPLAALAVVSVYAAVLWISVPRLGNVGWVWDSVEYERYAQALDTTGHIPSQAVNYEFSLPPGQPALVVGLERAARFVGPVDLRVGASAPRPLRVVVWLALVLGAGALLLGGASRRARQAGFVLAALAVALALLDVVSAATSVNWVPGLLPSVASVVAVVALSGLLARELWPEAAYAPALGALGAALLPVLFRMGTVFHPDPLFALLVDAALLLTFRARRAGWSLGAGAATGVLLALAAWTRQSAVVVMVAVALAAFLLAGRSAWRFLVAAAAAVALIAGPWWGYQASVYGNPIQSNLNRPGYMLSREPLSFFVDVPGTIVTDPWSLAGENLLLPKFHVQLWSDWTGVGASGGSHGSTQKALASTQSVLGFGGDALVLGGVVLLGVPALLRAVRGRAEREDRSLAALAAVFLVVWAAFLAELLRFPQRDADPDSPHYLVFLAPVAVALGLGAGRRLWAHGGWQRLAVGAWATVALASWIWVLAIFA